MTTSDITGLPASAFAGGCQRYYWCGTKDKPTFLDRPSGVCMRNGTWWCSLACRARREEPPDTTLVKSSRPATCAVCREDVTGSIELPTGEHCCGECCCIALRNMIDDAAACRTESKETK